MVPGVVSDKAKYGTSTPYDISVRVLHYVVLLYVLCIVLDRVCVCVRNGPTSGPSAVRVCVVDVFNEVSTRLGSQAHLNDRFPQ